MLLKHFAVT